MARKFPPEIHQLAETYRLGTPVKRHIGLGWIILYAWLIAIFLLGGVSFTAAAFAPPGMNLLFVSCLELIFIGGIAIYGFLLLRVRSHYAYECTDGFVEISRKTRKVTHALRWDQVWKTRSSTGARSLPAHYVTGIDHHEFEVPYHAIWKRCTRAAAHRNSVPKMKLKH